jgi:hypothetical protein
MSYTYQNGDNVEILNWYHRRAPLPFPISVIFRRSIIWHIRTSFRHFVRPIVLVRHSFRHDMLSSFQLPSTSRAFLQIQHISDGTGISPSRNRSIRVQRPSVALLGFLGFVDTVPWQQASTPFATIEHLRCRSREISIDIRHPQLHHICRISSICRPSSSVTHETVCNLLRTGLHILSVDSEHCPLPCPGQCDTFRIYHFERSIEKASQHIRFLCAHNCLNFRTYLIHVEACLLVFALTDKNTCRAQAVTQANQGLRSLWITCAASTMAVFVVRDPGAGSNWVVEIYSDAV